ncbi:ABC transporter permease [Nocardioides sp. NPDC126508]
MIRFLVLRTAGIIGVLLAVTAATYVIFYVFPADPARMACGKPCTPESLAQAREFLGVDQPLWVQYLEFLKGLVAGRTFGEGGGAIACAAPCLGYSVQHHQSVTTLIAQTFPVTVSIAAGAAVLWLLTGVAAGTVSALRRGRLPDRAVMTMAMVGVSMPSYLVGLLAILFFGFTLDVVPVGSYVPLTENPVDWAFHLITPWCVLALLNAAIYARLTRSQLLETLGEDFVRTARAKGLRERTVVVRHALRTALVPVVTVFGLDLGALLGGAVITERVFSMYGLGALLIDAVGHTDLPVITGVTILAAAFVVVANLVVDLAYRALDPRV